MYRKLNCHIYIAVILIFFNFAFAHKDKADAAYCGSVILTIAESSEQSGNSLAKLRLKTENKDERFRPIAFFSAKGRKNLFKGLNQKSQILSKKGWKSLLVWARENKILLLVSAVLFIIIIFSTFYYNRQKKLNRFMTTTRLSVVNNLVQQACRHIEKKYAETDLTVDKLCNDLITGKAYLEVLFKKELGMRVEDFINQVRINRVKIIVNREPQISLQEIAGATGFSDVNECLAIFHSVCGVDFENYRNKIINNHNQF